MFCWEPKQTPAGKGIYIKSVLRKRSWESTGPLPPLFPPLNRTKQVTDLQQSNDLSCFDLISFDLRCFDLICFDLFCFDLTPLGLICFDVSCLDFICFDLICFDLICFELVCFDLSCFDFICFDLICFTHLLGSDLLRFDVRQNCFTSI